MAEERLELDPHQRPGAEVFPRPRFRVPQALRRPFPIRGRGWWRFEREIPEGAEGEGAQRRDARYRRALAVADIASATVAIAIGIPLVGHDALNPLALAAIPFIVIVSKVTGLYDRDENLLRKTTLDEAPTLFRVALLYTFLTWLGGEYVVEGTFGRDQALGVLVLLFVGMFAGRATARLLVRLTTYPERCLIIGDPGAALWVARKLGTAPALNAEIIGRVPLRRETGSSNGLPIVGEISRLDEVLTSQQIDRAIIAPAGGSDDSVLDAIRDVKAFGVKVSVLPRLFEVVGSSVDFDEIDGMTLLGIRRHGLSRSSSAVKRALDLTGATLGVLLLAPLVGMIALAIKLDTPGPVFFRQRRMGRADRSFEMLKFRTMVRDADEQKASLEDRNEAGGGLFKIENDPRITRVGRFLRRTSLDELPQFFNVLRGDMSLVGPRPLVIDEDRQIEGVHRRRLLLPPGMTGLWQVFGSARIPLHEMVKIDYLYGAN